jgi:hypothetical protein
LTNLYGRTKLKPKKESIIWLKAQSDDLWTAVMGLSRQNREETSSSIATIWKEWNLEVLEEDRKWNMRRVRDVMVAPQQLT